MNRRPHSGYHILWAAGTSYREVSFPSEEEVSTWALLPAVVGGIMAPTDALIPIPRTCGYGGFHGRRDFEEQIIAGTCRWRYYLRFSRWAQCSHRGLYKGEKEAEELETETKMR